MPYINYIILQWYGQDFFFQSFPKDNLYRQAKEARNIRKISSGNRLRFAYFHGYLAQIRVYVSWILIEVVLFQNVGRRAR